MTEGAGDSWEDLPASSYQADGLPALLVIARMVTEDGSLRVVKHTRPFQEGWKLDDTGANGDDLQVEMMFHPDVDEGDTNDGQLQIWPDRLEALIRQFKTGKTGTLHLPWKRNLRVKPDKWNRRATSDEHRGGEILTVTFTTDNEDDLDREAFEGVSVKSQLERRAEATKFDMDSVGAATGSIEDVTQLAADLVGLMNAPGDYAAAIAHQAQRVRRAAQFLLEGFTTAVTGRDQLNDPAGSRGARGLLDLLDFAAGAEAEASERLPRTRTARYPTDRDIFSIAAELGQNANDLMSINSALEDPSFIPRGAPVTVFAE
jgi:prophage DNA circulation protein